MHSSSMTTLKVAKHSSMLHNHVCYNCVVPEQFKHFLPFLDVVVYFERHLDITQYVIFQSLMILLSYAVRCIIIVAVHKMIFFGNTGFPPRFGKNLREVPSNLRGSVFSIALPSLCPYVCVLYLPRGMTAYLPFRFSESPMILQECASFPCLFIQSFSGE